MTKTLTHAHENTLPLSYREFIHALKSSEETSLATAGAIPTATIRSIIKAGSTPDAISVCVDRSGNLPWVDLPLSLIGEIERIGVSRTPCSTYDFVEITFVANTSPTSKTLCELISALCRCRSQQMPANESWKPYAKSTIAGHDLAAAISKGPLYRGDPVVLKGRVRISEQFTDTIEFQLSGSHHWTVMPEPLIASVGPMRRTAPDSLVSTELTQVSIELARPADEHDTALQALLRELTVPILPSRDAKSHSHTRMLDNVPSNVMESGPHHCGDAAGFPCLEWSDWDDDEQIWDRYQFGIVYLFVPPVNQKYHVSVQLESTGRNITNQSGVDPTGGPYDVDIGIIDYSWSMHGTEWSYVPTGIGGIVQNGYKLVRRGALLWQGQRENRGNNDQFDFPEVSQVDSKQDRWYAIHIGAWTNRTRGRRSDDPRSTGASINGSGIGATAYCRWNDGKWGGELTAICRIVQ